MRRFKESGFYFILLEKRESKNRKFFVLEQMSQNSASGESTQCHLSQEEEEGRKARSGEEGEAEGKEEGKGAWNDEENDN